MTDMARDLGMGMLWLVWPHRASDPETMAATSGLYGELLADLSDAAFLGACRRAADAGRHFPVPAELREFAEEAAEEAQGRRMAAMHEERIRTAITDAGRLLTAGTVTEEQAAANRERYAAMAAETMAAIKAGGEKLKAERRQEFWTGRAGRRHTGGNA